MYADPGAAAAAVREMNGVPLAGRELRVSLYNGGGRRPPLGDFLGGLGPRMQQQTPHRAGPLGSTGGPPTPGLQHHHASSPTFCNVYIKGLADGVTEEALEGLFSPYGSITSAVVIRDSNGRPRGFGFVNFEREADAARAVALLDGHVTGPGAAPWTVTRAQTKSERQQEAQARLERVSGGAPVGCRISARVGGGIPTACACWQFRACALSRLPPIAAWA